MSKLTETTWLAVVLLITLSLAAPALARLAAGLTPLLIVAGVLAILWRVVSWYTR
jgi:hypothetical protein